jgi:hypothetical protein
VAITTTTAAVTRVTVTIIERFREGEIGEEEVQGDLDQGGASWHQTICHRHQFWHTFYQTI